MARDPSERPSVKQILNSAYIKNSSYDEKHTAQALKKKMELVLAKQAKEKSQE